MDNQPQSIILAALNDRDDNREQLLKGPDNGGNQNSPNQVLFERLDPNSLLVAAYTQAEKEIDAAFDKGHEITSQFLRATIAILGLAATAWQLHSTLDAEISIPKVIGIVLQVFAVYGNYEIQKLGALRNQDYYARLDRIRIRDLYMSQLSIQQIGKVLDWQAPNSSLATTNTLNTILIITISGMSWGIGSGLLRNDQSFGIINGTAFYVVTFTLYFGVWIWKMRRERNRSSD